MKIRCFIAFLLALMLLTGSRLAADPIRPYPDAIGKVSVFCEIFPASHSISVEGEITYYKGCDEGDYLSFGWATDTLKFWDEKGTPLSFTSVDGEIDLAPAFPVGTHTLHFAFSAELPEAHSNSSILTRDYVYLDAKSGWYPLFPCVLASGRNIFVSPWHMEEMAVTAPDGFTIVGTGTAVGKKQGKGKTTWYFRTTSPITTGMVVCGGRYQEISDRFRGITYRILVPAKQQFSEAKSWKEYVERTLGFYLDRYGFFPYPEIRIVSRPWLSDGKNWSTQHGILLMDGPKKFLSSPLSIIPANVLAHEINHQYWGGIVTCIGIKTKELVGEGLTEYISLLCIQPMISDAEFQKILSMCVENIKRIPPEEDIELVKVDRKHPHYLVYAYDKVSLFLLELRRVVGDVKMREIESTFCKRYMFGEPASFKNLIDVIRSAIADDSQAQLVCKRWLEEKGLPEITIASATKCLAFTESRCQQMADEY